MPPCTARATAARLTFVSRTRIEAEADVILRWEWRWLSPVSDMCRNITTQALDRIIGILSRRTTRCAPVPNVWKVQLQLHRHRVLKQHGLCILSGMERWRSRELAGDLQVVGEGNE